MNVADPDVDMSTLKSWPVSPFPLSPTLTMKVLQDPSKPSKLPAGGKLNGTGVDVLLKNLIVVKGVL